MLQVPAGLMTHAGVILVQWITSAEGCRQPWGVPGRADAAAAATAYLMLVVTDPRLLVEDLLESLVWKASLPWPSSSMSCSRKLSCPCSGAAALRLLDSVGGDSPSLTE